MCGGEGCVPVQFTADDCRTLYDSGKAMLSAGLQIPIPLEHRLNVDEDGRLASTVSHNAGFVGDYQLDPDGSLWGGLDIDFIPDPTGGQGWRDPADIQHRLEKTIRYVSPSIVPGFRDGTGKLWDGITHVALTPVPVWHTQAPFGTPYPGHPAPQLSMSRAVSWRKQPVALSLPAGNFAVAVGTWAPTSRTLNVWEGPFTGKRGGKYWVSARTGKKVYQDEQPGAHQHGDDQEPSPKSDATGWPQVTSNEIADAFEPNIVHTPEAPHELETAGGASGAAGLLSGEPPGEEFGAPPAELPAESGEGTGDGVAGIPGSESLPSLRHDDPAGGPGDAAAHGEGTGTGGDVSDGGAGNLVAESLSEPPTPENPTDLAAGNWRYHTRDFAAGGLKQKFRNNITAIKTLATIKTEGRDTATPEEQEALSKFVGWGQFPGVFNDYYDHEGREEMRKLREAEGLAEPEEDPEQDPEKWEAERKELKGLLSTDEWKSARRSTLNAHFTHPDIVDAHWQMARRLGFNGGRFLETSAGAGYYLGMMPPELAGSTHSAAVELDSITGRIAQLLYPAATVNVQGFEKYQSPENFYDLVASNVPFGKYQVNDPKYNKFKASIHDYFFLKSADLVRPGGLVMHITSTGTLDKGDDKIRQELAKTCDLVSAIRFPGGAHKENAGTDVVTDMLILRKRLPGEAPGDTSWLKTGTVPDPDGGDDMPINQYFVDHPEQVLGRLDRSGTMYRAENVNVNLVSPEELTDKLGRKVTVDVDDKGKRHFVYDDGSRVPNVDVRRVGMEHFRRKLREAIERVPEGIYTREKPEDTHFAPERLPAPGDVKDGGFHIKGGKLFQREGGALIEKKTNKKALASIQGQLAIRDAMREIVNLESEGHDSTEARAKLNTAYDDYVKVHGFLHEKMNRQAMHEDPDHPNLLSLEKWDSKTQTATKGADMFTRETIRHIPQATHADSAAEGLGISLHENGRVDIDHIAKLTGQHKDAVAKELVEKGHAFEDPNSGFLPADQYLSGNVRRKLTMARAAAAVDPKYKANVEALEKVQPEDLEYTDIDVRLGAPWVPPADVAAFAAHLVEGDADDFKIGHYAHNGEWTVKVEGHGRATQAWVTEHANFEKLLTAALNNKPITIYEPGETEGSKVVNLTATRDAQAKVEEIKDAFFKEGSGWLWEDDERRDRLTRYYNDNFNNIRTITYDGSHQTFPGMNPNFKPHPHIPNAVWQVVTTGKALFGHEVGTGKTTAMVASAMELRRLGLARKPAIACLKSNIEQITQEALQLYPGAKIISTADMFDAKKRQQVMARIASGDYDMVIMTHEHLNSMRMKPAVIAKYIEEEMDDLTNAIIEARKDDPQGKGRIVKDLEKVRLKLGVAMEAALNEKVKDNTVFFEDTGIDHLFVDESHNFQGLPAYTRMGQVKGISTRRSQRATNMLMRCHWLLDRNGDRGVVFATGTPITNTMGEMYNNMRYLQPKDLKERGVQSFDAWAATFGNVATKGEFTVAGEYKPTARFRAFTNVSELGQIAGQVQDIQRLDNMKKAGAEGITIAGKAFAAGAPIPPQFLAQATEEERAKLVNTITRPHRRDDKIVSPDSPKMQALMKSLVGRAKAVAASHGPPQKGADNMLAICTDGRKGALDMRLLDPSAEDDPQSKTNQCVNKVLELLKAHPGKTQLIFSDLGVHDTGASKRASSVAAGNVPEEGEERDLEEEEIEAHKLSKFNLYGDIIDKLVKGGIPRDKIADFSQLEGVAKEEAQAALRTGEMLVALGSTQKLGTGVNVQNKVIAMHHLDVPWKPAHLEQRDGRGWRHGNENETVHIYRYVAEKSLDQKFWDVVSAKAKFIKQYMDTSGKGMRTIKDEDTETLTPEQLMAIASGDPRVMEKVDLEEEVKNLQFAESRHAREKVRLEKSIKDAENKVTANRERIARRAKDLEHLAANPDLEVTVGGQTFTERKGVDEALKEALKAWKESADQLPSWDYKAQDKLRAEPLGTYRGMTILPYSLKDDGYYVVGPSGEKWMTSGSLQSIEYVANKTIAKWKADDEAENERAIKANATITGKIGTYGAFPKAEELKAKRERLQQLEGELKTGEQSLLTEEMPSGGPAPGASVGGGGSAGAIAAAAMPKSKRAAASLDTMPFGEHKGKPFAEVPRDYLQWAVDKAGALKEHQRQAIRDHLEATKPAPAPAPEPKPGKHITEEQREAIHQSLKQLHGNNDDQATERNAVGFNSYDQGLGGQLAELPWLTDGQAEAGANLLGKYKRQLGEELHGKATTFAEPPEKPPEEEKSAVDWGKPYADLKYILPDGSEVHMRRNGQRVRYYDTKGEQVGPEQGNVAPAIAFAETKGWREKEAEEAKPASTAEPAETPKTHYTVSGRTYDHREAIKAAAKAAGGFATFDGDTKTWKVPAAAADKLRSLKGLTFFSTALPADRGFVFVRPTPANLTPAPPISQSRTSTKAGVQLSHGGRNMMPNGNGNGNGKKRDPEQDEPDESSFGSDDLEDGAGLPGNSKTATISKVSQELEEMGLMVDPSKDADEFLEHLATAIKTHKATKSLADGGADDPNGGDMANQAGGAGAGAGTPTPEQNQYTMMSRRVVELEGELASRRMSEVTANLDLAVKAGLIEQAKCDGYKAKLKAKLLSLVRKNDNEISVIIALADELAPAASKALAAAGLLNGHVVDMSRSATAVERPNGQWGSKVEMTEENSEECADQLVGKKRKVA
jgi:N12 class adenine-specific DNA methylase/uncharacterized protein (DUF3820 family)